MAYWYLFFYIIFIDYFEANTQFTGMTGPY